MPYNFIMRIKFHFLILSLLMTLTIIGCATSLHRNAFVLNEEALKKRTMQSQRFASLQKKQIMSAVVGVMQDLGFTLDEGDSDLGVFVGSKSRSAVDARQRLSAVLQALGSSNQVVIDKFQKFRLSVIIYPTSDKKDIVRSDYLVRTNFQRIVWNNLNQVSRAESLNDPEFFRDFFSRLSKSLFLDKADL